MKFNFKKKVKMAVKGLWTRFNFQKKVKMALKGLGTRFNFQKKVKMADDLGPMAWSLLPEN